MKYEWAMKGFGPPLSSFATVSHEHHRIRRNAVAPFFSKASVSQLEPVVQLTIQKLVTRLEGIKQTGTVINLIDVFVSLTADIICQYCFASPYGFLDEPDFAPHWHQAMMDVTEAFQLFKQVGWLEPTTRMLPTSVVKAMNPRLGALFTLQEVNERYISVLIITLIAA